MITIVIDGSTVRDSSGAFYDFESVSEAAKHAYKIMKDNYPGAGVRAYVVKDNVQVRTVSLRVNH